jgi:catechol 2,3-dioxygenase-like lactoylglutathione lyase family enzyme
MFPGPLSCLLYVSDLKRSVAFYRDVLGFDFHGFWDDARHRYELNADRVADCGYAEVFAGKTRIGLHQASPGRVNLGGGAEHHLEVPDVDVFHAEVFGRGAAAGRPEETHWGWRMFSVPDPDGHVWNFYKPADDAAATVKEGIRVSVKKPAKKPARKPGKKGKK